MSSIVERLTEGVVNRDMRAESHALLSKWKKTGLLEGIETERKQNSMARLLENQAKELLRESTSMASGDVEGFAAVAFPIVRRVFAGLIANDLVSVQPMSLPSGLIFFLDFTFSGELAGDPAGQDRRFGNLKGKSIYGTDQVGSQVVDGVDLVGALGGDLSGPRTATARGYAYASPTGSLEIAAADVAIARVVLSGTAGADMSVSDAKKIQFDPDLIAVADAAGTNAFVELTIAQADLPANLDTNNLAAIDVTPAQLIAISGSLTATTGVEQVRRLNRRGDDGELLLYFVGPTGSLGAGDGFADADQPRRRG
jgi:hypothetical protein